MEKKFLIYTHQGLDIDSDLFENSDQHEALEIESLQINIFAVGTKK